MRGRPARPVTVSTVQRQLLQRIVRGHRSPQRLVRRARVVLELASGASNKDAARRLGLDEDTMSLWRGRWADAQQRLAGVEAEASARELGAMIRQVLADAPRPGVPATFTPEQVTQIIALACEQPEDSERPVSHWTARELADEAVARGIVERISRRHIARFFGGGGSSSTPKPLLAQRQASRS